MVPFKKGFTEVVSGLCLYRYLEYKIETSSTPRVQKQELNYKENKLQCTIVVPEGMHCSGVSSIITVPYDTSLR